MSGILIKKSGVPVDLQTAFDASDGTPYEGVVSLVLYELQADGTLFGYDFHDETFSYTPDMPSSDLGGTDVNGVATSIRTAALSYTGFTLGNTYVAEFRTSETPPRFDRQRFQYGGQDGDDLASQFVAAVMTIGGGYTFTSPAEAGVAFGQVLMDYLANSGMLLGSQAHQGFTIDQLGLIPVNADKFAAVFANADESTGAVATSGGGADAVVEGLNTAAPDEITPGSAYAKLLHPYGGG